ncbi:MAG: hypothetical protein EPO68_11060, partial [Planctomycetota bacterium]
MRAPTLPFVAFRDRANPVLVRELRQSFRGKQFRIVFALASTFGLVASVVAMLAESDPAGVGRGLFAALGIALSIACLVLVPVGAFQSLSSEWEEGTWDLLEMTSLRPWQIVLGKLLSAGLQCLLYFAGVAPFLVFCFVLRGVGLIPILYLMGHLLATALAATAVAIALSSLTRQRVLRGVLLGLLVILLVPMSTGVGGLMLNLMVFSGRGALVGAPSMWYVIASWVTTLGVFTAIAYCVACARLSHPEENRSTPLRIVASAALLLLIGSQLVGTTMSTGGGTEVGIGICVWAVIAGCFGALFASEREAFGRRTRLQVPAKSLRARLAAAWLPGGGRGVLWLFAHLALIVAVAPLVLAVSSSDSIAAAYGMLLAAWIPGIASAGVVDSIWGGGVNVPTSSGAEWPVAIAIVACYLVFYVGVATSALAWIRSNSAPLRVARALAPFVLFVVTALVPGIFGVMLSDADLMSLSHPFNPIAVVAGVMTDRDVSDWRWYPPVLALVGLALALPRCRRAFAEVAQASIARRERDRIQRPMTAG